MSNYYRRDEWVTDAMGNPISGVQVFVCNQPANTSTVPPYPLAFIYSDPAGSVLLDQVTPGGLSYSASTGQTTYKTSQQIITDQNGHADYYLLPGTYTMVYYSPRIAGQILALTDQIVAPPYDIALYVSDSTSAGTIHPLPDGVNRAFDLSSIPNPATSLVFTINGLVQLDYTLVYGTVSLSTAPPPGTVLTANYAVV